MGAAMVLNMQAPVEVEELEEEVRNIQPLVHFLRLEMEGVDGQSRRWTSFKDRLGCCGVACGLNGRTMSVLDDEEEENDDENGGPNVTPLQSPHQHQNSSLGCVNLATALAADRQLRAMQQSATAASPTRVSLLRLLEEAEGVGKAEEDQGKEGSGSGCCCVCMVRDKGAAFIPCGHTFCRVCSREVWLNRGSCPLCNRRILEILDIF